MNEKRNNRKKITEERKMQRERINGDRKKIYAYRIVMQKMYILKFEFIA